MQVVLAFPVVFVVQLVHFVSIQPWLWKLPVIPFHPSINIPPIPGMDTFFQFCASVCFWFLFCFVFLVGYLVGLEVVSFCSTQSLTV